MAGSQRLRGCSTARGTDAGLLPLSSCTKVKVNVEAIHCSKGHSWPGKDYRADLGGLGTETVLTRFIYSDSWESERQTLEAKKGEAAAHFDEGTGVKFNVIVYDVEFSREITDPVSGRRGVIYAIRMAEAS